MKRGTVPMKNTWAETLNNKQIRTENIFNLAKCSSQAPKPLQRAFIKKKKKKIHVL